mmetsp:Transcript_73143/g.174300  ORF Transcript_73143/g.174300 Transcript_73143/m.174300 type:complete len:233 (-) Transcript_73143:44-742(-)
MYLPSSASLNSYRDFCSFDSMIMLSSLSEGTFASSSHDIKSCNLTHPSPSISMPAFLAPCLRIQETFLEITVRSSSVGFRAIIASMAFFEASLDLLTPNKASSLSKASSSSFSSAASACAGGAAAAAATGGADDDEAGPAALLLMAAAADGGGLETALTAAGPGASAGAAAAAGGTAAGDGGAGAAGCGAAGSAPAGAADSSSAPSCSFCPSFWAEASAPIVRLHKVLSVLL